MLLKILIPIVLFIFFLTSIYYYKKTDPYKASKAFWAFSTVYSGFLVIAIIVLWFIQIHF